MNIIKFTLTLMLALALSLPAFAYPPPKLTREWKKVVKMYVPTKDGKGRISASGLPIDKALFLTAGHFCAAALEGDIEGVLEDNVYIQFFNANDELITIKGGEIIKFEFSPSQDLCLVRRPKHGIVPVKIAVGLSSFGEKVHLVGAPHGIYPTITDGYVGQGLTQGMPLEILNNKVLTSAACTNGNSGGALFNKKGEVIGVGVMAHPEYPHISFAVTVIDIWRFLFE